MCLYKIVFKLRINFLSKLADVRSKALDAHPKPLNVYPKPLNGEMLGVYREMYRNNKGKYPNRVNIGYLPLLL